MLHYCNTNEKNRNKELAFELFETLLVEHMKRNTQMIIIEYPFRKKWASLFRNLSDKYGYEYIVINVCGADCDLVWNHLNKRNLSSDRHPSHSRAESYNVRDNTSYVPSNEVDYAEFKEDYTAGTFTSLEGDYTYTFKNTYGLFDVEELAKLWRLVDEQSIQGKNQICFP